MVAYSDEHNATIIMRRISPLRRPRRQYCVGLLRMTLLLIVVFPCVVWQFQESLAVHHRQTREASQLRSPSFDVLSSLPNSDRRDKPGYSNTTTVTPSDWREGCAINFYGLPRSFRKLVLPSVLRNVIRTNRAYGCDSFVHFYNLSTEAAGRSGAGGRIHAEDILSLRKAVQRYSPQSVVLFVSDSNASFTASHQDLIHEISTARDETGATPLYFPWLEQGYDFPNTIVNIFKMWHSIDRAWTLMEDYGRKHRIRYTRVAMLRSDVVYMTPLDIWGTGKVDEPDVNNEYVVVPAFARYPVNDRAIYGNASGVSLWATGRFSALSQHVDDYQGSGYVLHHEHFLDSSIFTSIRRRAGVKIAEDERLCFCRARADQRVWYNDCTKSVTPQLKQSLPTSARDWLQAVEQVVNRTCGDERKESVPGSLSFLCH
jgi:hypothetical protein